MQDAGLHLPRAVRDVVEAGAPGELPHRREAAGPRAELRVDVGAPEVVAAHEADLRVEVAADEQVVDEEAVAVALVGERGLVAPVVAVEAGRVRAGVVAVQVHVVVERERPVDAVRLVRAGAAQRDRAVGEDGADAAPAQDVALHAEHAEVRGGGPGVVGPDVDGPDAEVAHLAGQASAAHDRHGPPRLVEADPPAEEEGRGVAGSEEAGRPGEVPARRCAEASEAGRPPEVEDALAFEEELAFLREEQAEPRQVDLLLVHLHLREVGVEGEVRGQVLGESVLEVDAAVPAGVVRDGGRGGAVGVERADRVGLDLERAVALRHLQADEGAGDRQAELSRPGRDRHRREIRLLVARSDVPAHLDAPQLRGAGPEAEGLEGDRHLDGPAAVEAAGAHVPDRIPVGVRVPLVGDLPIAEPADGVDPEGEAVPAVVEGVEHDDEPVVVDELERVALHLVGDPRRLGDRLVNAGRRVDRLVVEEDPGVGRLRGRGPFVGRLLNEAPERLDAGVDRLVEHAVQPQGRIEADGAHRRPAGGVAGDGGRRDRGGRTVDRRRRLLRRGPGRPRREQDARRQRGRKPRRPPRGAEPPGGGPRHGIPAGRRAASRRAAAAASMNRSGASRTTPSFAPVMSIGPARPACRIARPSLHLHVVPP